MHERPYLSNTLLTANVEQQYPFLFYDCILTQTATHLTARKCISQDEWAHTRTTRYPFWCLLESMAQTAGVLVQQLQASTMFPNRVLSRIRRARYYRPLEVGDILTLEVHLLKHLERHSAYRVEAYCATQKAGWAEMYFFHF